MITLYDRETPETESFIRRIDDSEIDITQVEAKLHDLECERDCARESLAKIKAWADQALSAVYDKDIAAAFEQISDEADMSNASDEARVKPVASGALFDQSGNKSHDVRK